MKGVYSGYGFERSGQIFDKYGSWRNHHGEWHNLGSVYHQKLETAEQKSKYNTNEVLIIKLNLIINFRQWNRWIRTCTGPQKKNYQWAAHHLSSKHPHSLNSLCNKLFQAFLLWIHNFYKSYVPASLDNSLYFCFPISASNSLCQDDRCLAHILSADSICRGINHHLFFKSCFDKIDRFFSTHILMHFVKMRIEK